MSDQPWHDPELIKEQDDRPREEKLWKAVLMQAVADACGNAYKSCQYVDRRLARSWLTVPSKDFMMVCELAGICPKQAYDSIQQELKRRGVG